MHRNIKLIASVSLIAGTTACGITSAMEVPAVATTEQINVDLPLGDQATFALRKVIANIKRGTPVLHYPSSGLSDKDIKGSLCNYGISGDGVAVWGAGTSFLGNWRNEFGEIFYETLSNKNLNIAGDPRDLFGNENAVSSAEYHIGAVVTEIRGNICHAHHWWDGRPLYTYSGEIYMDVEWTVFSNLQRREVLKTRTVGYYKQAEPTKNGKILMMHETFARATENLTAKKEFIAIATREERPADLTRNVGSAIEFRSPSVQKTKPLKDIEDLLPAVVTIRAGSGHGSGFSISQDGLILTNAHVVGEAKRVAVVLSNNIEVFGTVERYDKKRDVALVKVPLRMPEALPLRIRPVETLEKVYAIGSPLDETLKSTVTTGIVSALRKSKKTGQTLIQADAAISPGNSGGPLLDRFGNVVGISVLSFVNPRAQNLNGFIPIGEALETLNLKITSADRQSGS